MPKELKPSQENYHSERWGYKSKVPITAVVSPYYLQKYASAKICFEIFNVLESIQSLLEVVDNL